MAESQRFCLRWSSYQPNIVAAFSQLREEEDFVDVTLACEGKSIKAHKMLLSACSPFFKTLLKVRDSPLLILGKSLLSNCLEYNKTVHACQVQHLGQCFTYNGHFLVQFDVV
jgi:hypothetical protein